LGNPLTGDHLRITPDGDISCDLEFLHLEILQDIEDPEPTEPTEPSSEPVHGFDQVLTNASETERGLDSRNPSSAGEPGVLDPQHIDFLVSCEIELQLKTEMSETLVARMAELLARSENLNLSGNRHDRESLMTKHTSSSIWVAGNCRDRFGDYGLVLAAQIDVRESSVHIMDLAMSCRVAEKAVEYAFLEWVRTVPSTLDGPLITVNLVPGARNQPLERSLHRCGFVNDDAGSGMWIDGSHPVAGSHIVKAVSCGG
jgi:predicted enzyme involved in methoxymalonyl-ACP biosynthesis